MSNNSGSCKLVKFEPCEKVENQLLIFAEEFFEVISIDYTSENKEQLVGYMRCCESEENLLVSAKNAGIMLPKYSIENISSQDWLTENVIKFSPVYVADFVVYGVHEKNVDIKDKIGVKVYAATAFGSEHQTTKGCLQALSEINRIAGVQNKVLDVGTGSGVLAIAAAKLWPNTKVVAVDIDEESVAVAGQNAVDNGVKDRVTVAYSNGYSAPIVQQEKCYNVIFANILARPLIAMAHDMATFLAPDGYAVISGFIDDQLDWVVGAHEQYGLNVVKIYEIDQWRTVLLKKEV